MDIQRFLIQSPGLAPFLVWAPTAGQALAVGRDLLGWPLAGATAEPYTYPTDPEVYP